MSGIDPFERIVCAVDGGPAADEAVRQAARIAGPWSRLEIVAVAAWGAQPLSGALTQRGGEEALDHARGLANGPVARARGRVVRAGDPAEALAAAVSPRDLLVVGSAHGSRARGFLHATVPTSVMHRPQCAVLVARKPPAREAFPGRMLLASDGSNCSQRAAQVAGGIARRAGSELALVHVAGEEGQAVRHELAVETIAVREATGIEPALWTLEGRAHREIVELARRERFSLIVLGRRGLDGARALGSVSERVGHDADQSVLIVPPR